MEAAQLQGAGARERLYWIILEFQDLLNKAEAIIRKDPSLRSKVTLDQPISF